MVAAPHGADARAFRSSRRVPFLRRLDAVWPNLPTPADDGRRRAPSLHRAPRDGAEPSPADAISAARAARRRRASLARVRVDGARALAVSGPTLPHPRQREHPAPTVGLPGRLAIAER